MALDCQIREKGKQNKTVLPELARLGKVKYRKHQVFSGRKMCSFCFSHHTDRGSLRNEQGYLDFFSWTQSKHQQSAG